ncbi:MAG: hypothetical protein M3400_04330, partial [Actinomycetota bacterium]|nr:hypothetical protein [Actinomycetota bacterium]
MSTTIDHPPTVRTAAETAAEVGRGAHPRTRSLAGYLFMPVFLLLTLAALFLWVSSQELSSGEQRRLNAESILGNIR